MTDLRREESGGVAPLGLRKEGGASQSNLTIQIPFRLPFSRAITFFSIKPAIILLTVRVDFPICTAISSCLVFPFSFRILTIASSSNEHFKVSFWHFGEVDMALWGNPINRSRFLKSFFSPRIRFRKKRIRYSSVA